MPGAKGAGVAKEIPSPKNDYVFKRVFDARLRSV
jgi:hypothetical protein